MSDSRYDQYGAKAGVNTQEKLQGSFSGRTISVPRYNNAGSGMVNQARIPGNQGVIMGELNRSGSISNPAGIDRRMSIPISEDIDSSSTGYVYSAAQIKRAISSQGMQRPNASPGNFSDGNSFIPSRPNNSTMIPSGTPQIQPSYAIDPSSKMVSYSSESAAEDIREVDSSAIYKLYLGVFLPRADRATWFNYVLPPSYTFPRPELSNEQLKSFSTPLLLYIFYSMPRDLLSAQELYLREYVYHKTKRMWYKREKASANYAVVNCGEVFDLDSWTFMPCCEVHKISDVMSTVELNDYLKKLPK